MTQVKIQLPKQALAALATQLGLAIALAGCAPTALSPATSPAGNTAANQGDAIATPPSAGPKVAPLVMRQAAPIVHFKDAAGEDHALDEWKGRFVVLMYFSVTCAVCQQEVPKIQAFAARYGPEAAVLAVEGTGASASDVAAFASTYKVAMPLYHDLTREAANAYLVKFFPQGYILSPDFVVQEDVRGRAANSFYETRLGLYAPDVLKAGRAADAE